MSRGHGELQQWILAELERAAANQNRGPWMSASEMTEARCQYLHGANTHPWGRRAEWRDWPQRLTRSSYGYDVYAPARCCPVAASTSTSIRRALGRLAAEGVIQTARGGLGGRYCLIARLLSALDDERPAAPVVPSSARWAALVERCRTEEED